MTNHPQIFNDLARPFTGSEVKQRDAPGGRRLDYITARTAMNRLDEVLGPENWWDEFVPLENSVICKLTIQLPDGQTVTKSDAGGYAGMADQGDDDKSGFSDAFKRAAAKFGVGRHLYRDGYVTFAARETEPQAEGRTTAPASQPAASVVIQRPPSGPSGPSPSSAPSGGGNHGVPRSGKALFAWSKEQEEKHQVGLIKYLNGWAKLQDFPSRMVDWDAEQVGLAHAEAVRKLASMSSDAPPAHQPSAHQPAVAPVQSSGNASFAAELKQHLDQAEQAGARNAEWMVYQKLVKRQFLPTGLRGPAIFSAMVDLFAGNDEQYSAVVEACQELRKDNDDMPAF